jgi:hypothetical protein
MTVAPRTPRTTAASSAAESSRCASWESGRCRGGSPAAVTASVATSGRGGW